MKFRSLDREDSEYNEGWRFAVACGGAATLLVMLSSLFALLIGLMSWPRS